MNAKLLELGAGVLLCGAAVKMIAAESEWNPAAQKVSRRRTR